MGVKDLSTFALALRGSRGKSGFGKGNPGHEKREELTAGSIEILLAIIGMYPRNRRGERGGMHASITRSLSE